VNENYAPPDTLVINFSIKFVEYVEESKYIAKLFEIICSKTNFSDYLY